MKGTKLPCDIWHPPECPFYESESGCKFGKECLFPHWKVEEQQNNRPKKGGDRSAVSNVKHVRQLGCVSQDVEPLESSAIPRKGTKVLGPIRRVQCSKTTLRHANIRESKGPPLGVIQIKNPHQRSPYAPKFDDRSQEETERQERCARGDAWRMAKSVLTAQRKGQHYILFAYRCIHNKTGGKRVCGGLRSKLAYGLQQKDLSSAELGTPKVSKNPTTVVTANGEVQTKEEATVYVRE